MNESNLTMRDIFINTSIITIHTVSHSWQSHISLTSSGESHFAGTTLDYKDTQRLPKCDQKNSETNQSNVLEKKKYWKARSTHAWVKNVAECLSTHHTHSQKPTAKIQILKIYLVRTLRSRAGIWPFDEQRQKKGQSYHPHCTVVWRARFEFEYSIAGDESWWEEMPGIRTLWKGL